MDLKKEKFKVSINSPDELIWEGMANSVSSKNSSGPFDILPEHANFITMIEGDPIIVRFLDKEHVFKYSNAVLSVYNNIVTVYTEL